jgi:thymidylate kinase
MAEHQEINRLDEESVQFHSRVHEAYHSLVEADPARWRIIDANRAENDVWSDVWFTVASSDLLATGPSPMRASRARQRPQ